MYKSYKRCIYAVCLAACALPGAAQNYYPQESLQSTARHEQRLASRRWIENHSFSSFGQGYIDLKNNLAETYDVQLGADISYTAQRTAPSGKQTAVQAIYYPYVTWGVFKDTPYGSGTVNVNYYAVQYWGTSAGSLANRTRVAAGINDSPVNADTFTQLSYTHTFAGGWNWLSVTVGQYPLNNFDGTDFTDNQQTALMNFSLSQNASAAYPSASLGAYAQTSAGKWTFAGGYQDAQNLSGQDLAFHTAFGGKYTVFGAASWAPDIEGWGPAQYAVLVYRQPAFDGGDSSDGWSVNLSQGLGEKWTFFARANGASGHNTGIKNSYAAGMSYADPLNRNPQDAFTLGIAYNRLDNRALLADYCKSAEAVLEAQWVIGVSKFVTLTPDVQFYPRAGLSQSGPAVAAGLRTTVML